MASGSDLKFVTEFLVCPEDCDLNQLLNQMYECNNDAVYKNLIDTILDRYVREHAGPDGHYVRNVLIMYFGHTVYRKNLGKYMCEKLSSRKIEDRSLFECIVDSVTVEIQENINNLNIFRIRQCFRMLYFLSNFMEHLGDPANHIYFQSKVFPFYLCILEVYTSQLFNGSFCRDGSHAKSILQYEDCYTVLELTLQQLALTLFKGMDESLKACSVKMVIITHDILQSYSQLKFETTLKCALVMCFFLLCLPPEERQFMKCAYHPILDFMFNKSSDFCLVLKSKTLSNLFSTEPMKVILNLSIFKSARKSMEWKIAGKSLLEILFHNFVYLTTVVSSSREQICPISDVMCDMSKKLVTLENYEEIFEDALTYSFTLLDHFVDVVVQKTKAFLSTMIGEASNRYKKGEQQHLEKFFYGINNFSVFSKVRLNAIDAISQVLDCTLILEKCPNVLYQLLTIATSSPNHDIAGQAYKNMMMNHFLKGDIEETISLWIRPVLNTLRQPHTKYHYVLVDIVTSAFQKRPEIFRIVFAPKTAGIGVECVIILKCVHYARLHGVVLPIEPEANPDDYWRGLILKNKMDLFMIHQDDDVRLHALQVLSECQKSTEEFTEWELIYITKYFRNNVSTQSAAFRNKLCSYYKKIITRYQTTYPNIVKRMTNITEKDPSVTIPEKDESKWSTTKREFETVKAIWTSYKNFFSHLVQLFLLYLSPDANHSRRWSCLELLKVVCPLGSSEDEWHIHFEEDDIKNLKHILNDGYEHNKSLAVDLLKTLPPKIVGFKNKKSTFAYFKKAMDMACDIRPSQSVSASYMFQLVLHSEFDFREHEQTNLNFTESNKCLMLLAMAQKLEVMFTDSKENIVEAADNTPFYGLLLSVRNLLRNRDIREDNCVYSYIFHKLANLCLTMKNHIMPMVCNDSPEGHIPEDTDDVLESDQSGKAQKILVYSWKTMKEIMALLAELANQTVTLENVLEMLGPEYLVKIGEFFVEVFIGAKHRGVFEQAHTVFTTVCRSYIHSKEESLNNLPVKWLNLGIALATGKQTDQRLCATRRSAGLPFLILSILPTLSEQRGEFLRGCMLPLLTVAQDSNDELRMHCLNVLRFVFKNSKLSDSVATYLDRGTIAALEGFRSRTWGVRNSATLLLASLISKIFGVPNRTSTDSDQDENRLTLAAFFLKHKELFYFLLKTLKEECEKSDSVILHPVLLILSRLYPSHNENVNEQVKNHIPYINVCMKNPSYRTRDLAARASVSLLSEPSLPSQLEANFLRISERISDRECHGLLLQTCHILQTVVIESMPISVFIHQSMHLLAEVGRRYSHLTVTLYMDILLMMLMKFRTYADLDLLRHLVSLLASQPPTVPISTCRSSFLFSRFLLETLILLNKFEHVTSTYNVVNRNILRFLYGDEPEMRKKVLHLLIYLNQIYSQERHKEHPLIFSGDIEISPQIKSLVHSLDPKSRKELLSCMHPFLVSFFYAELKAEKKDILVFLLLSFYPCFFKTLLAERRQNILDWFLEMAKNQNEEVISGIISCLKTFISTCEAEELKHLMYADLIRLLMQSAAPSAADFRRLTVAQFLIGTQGLFKNKIFSEYDRYNVVNIIMVLLEDDEVVVRNTMSQFPSKGNVVQTKEPIWRVIPSFARTVLLGTGARDMRSVVATGCLASWALRRLPEVTRDTSEVYERGEQNNFAENIPVIYSATTLLHALLWHLRNNLSYQDCSIFQEEQALHLTYNVLNALVKVPSPMVDLRTKRTVICIFKSIVNFLEGVIVSKSFHSKFRTFFNTTVLKFLRNSPGTDYASVKAFLTYLYNPLLNAHFRFPE